MVNPAEEETPTPDLDGAEVAEPVQTGEVAEVPDGAGDEVDKAGPTGSPDPGWRQPPPLMRHVVAS